MTTQFFQFHLFNNPSFLSMEFKKLANIYIAIIICQHCLKLFICINLVNAHKTTWDTYCYHSHFTDEKSGQREDKELVQDMDPESMLLSSAQFSQWYDIE